MCVTCHNNYGPVRLNYGNVLQQPKSSFACLLKDSLRTDWFKNNITAAGQAQSIDLTKAKETNLLRHHRRQ